MAEVNRPPLKVPAALEQDPELRVFFRDLLRHIYQQYNRTGGADDAIEIIQTVNTYETTSIAGRSAGLAAKLRDVEEELHTKSEAPAIAALRAEIDHLATQLHVQRGQSANLLNRIAELESMVSGTPAKLEALRKQLDDLETMTYAG